VREQQSSFFPTLAVSSQIQRQRSGGGAVGSGGAGGSGRGGGGLAITSYSLQGTATWEPDIWGKIRRNVESSVANAQASAAQLAAARLSMQAQLATDYFQLRYADSLRSLLDETVKSYLRSLQITQNQYVPERRHVPM
jgi:outer membrane protein TolC